MIYLSRRIYEDTADEGRGAPENPCRRHAPPHHGPARRRRDLRLRDPRHAAAPAADGLTPPRVPASFGPRRDAARGRLDPLPSRHARRRGDANNPRRRDAHARPRRRRRARCGSAKQGDRLLAGGGGSAGARVLRSGGRRDSEKRRGDRVTAALIESARDADAHEIERLLSANGLPLAGVRECLPSALVARDAGRIVGCAALELYKSGVLLRSVAVEQDWRGRGLGIELVEEALVLARSKGAASAYLLTT